MKSKILILLFIVSIVAGMIVPTAAFSDDGQNPNEADKGVKTNLAGNSKAPAAEQSAESGDGDDNIHTDKHILGGVQGQGTPDNGQGGEEGQGAPGNKATGGGADNVGGSGGEGEK